MAEVKSPEWRGDKLTEGSRQRWKLAQAERLRVGSTRVPRLVPRAEDSVDVIQLPNHHWTIEGPELLARAYALNDGRCPVLGCEPATAHRRELLAPITTYAPGRDSDRYLTKEGIIIGAAAGAAGGDVHLS